MELATVVIMKIAFTLAWVRFLPHGLFDISTTQKSSTRNVCSPDLLPSLLPCRADFVDDLNIFKHEIGHNFRLPHASRVVSPTNVQVRLFALGSITVAISDCWYVIVCCSVNNLHKTYVSNRRNTTVRQCDMMYICIVCPYIMPGARFSPLDVRCLFHVNC